MLSALTLYSVDNITNELGALDEMGIGRGNQSAWGKRAPVLLLPPQILYDLT
jgi:hypothetical protein